MTRERSTAGIILAAGRSARFGRPKQLAIFRGKPLLQWMLDAALASKLKRLVLVLGYKHRKIVETLGKVCDDPRLGIVVNRQYTEGQSASLKAGLAIVDGTYPSVMFLVADQPMLDAATIDLLLDRFWQSEKDICVPVSGGQRGNPTIFSSRWYPRLLATEGDTGARSIIDANPECIISVGINTPRALFDVDTQKDLDVLKRVDMEKDTGC